MRLVDDSITMAELREMAEHTYGDLVKAVVDVRSGCMVVDADLHSDEEALLLAQGSAQGDLWGINLYPDLTIADPRHRDRLKELCRMREVLLDYFIGPNDHGSSGEAWHRYFNYFTLAAAHEREQARAS